MGLELGMVCVMIHSGSRGLGHQTCTDYVRELDRLMPQLGIEVPDRQLACLPLSHEIAQAYLGSMTAAGNFARANRHVLAHATREAFADTFGGDADDIDIELVYDISHNLAKIESYTIDGVSKELCVHRKGATRAFGPGHPDLPSVYSEIGQPVIIPGSMGTASFVLTGLPGARDRSFSSSCHGAGRAMSRTKAKKQQHGHELRKELEDRGIIVSSGSTKLLSEEAPYAYKDVSEVVETCEGAGLTRVVARLRPVGVVKG
jgi:tRNA-splicing ligase RtcB